MFLELCSNLHDLPANRIRTIKDFTIYLTAMDSSVGPGPGKFFLGSDHSLGTV